MSRESGLRKAISEFTRIALLASDVIGFTRTDGTGTYGLEEYYNDVLSGVNRQTVWIYRRGR